MPRLPDRDERNSYEAELQALIEHVRRSNYDIMGIVAARAGNLLFDALPGIARVLPPQRKMNVTIVLDPGWDSDIKIQKTIAELKRNITFRPNSSVEFIERWQLTRPPISLN